MSALVTTQWLAAHLDDADVRLLDASWHMPSSGRRAREEFFNAHIPGSAFFDIDRIADMQSAYPHMLPSAQQFSAAVEELGISNKNHVIIYDASGLFSAARAWWMFKVFGHERVQVLDGGLPKWLAEGGKTESGEPLVRPSKGYAARYISQWIKSVEQVAQALTEGSAHVLDMRSAARFKGLEAEPRAGLRAGHMPASRNLHYALLLNEPFQQLASRDEIKALLQERRISRDKPIICSCGSGVTACILALALVEHDLASEISVYDGSWAEWGNRHDLPVEQG